MRQQCKLMREDGLEFGFSILDEVSFQCICKCEDDQCKTHLHAAVWVSASRYRDRKLTTRKPADDWLVFLLLKHGDCLELSSNNLCDNALRGNKVPDVGWTCAIPLQA